MDHLEVDISMPSKLGSKPVTGNQRDYFGK
jgi:hypothetical protein